MKHLNKLIHVALITLVIVLHMGCKKEHDASDNRRGQVVGTVTDANGAPIAGVKVTLTGIKEEDQVTTSGNDGNYTFSEVTYRTHAVTFEKDGWMAVGLTVTAAGFNEAGQATVDVAMVSASARIVGTVTDALQGGGPLAGVTVSIGAVGGTVTTDNSGRFVIPNLIENNYTVSFTKGGYVGIVRPITAADFVDGIVTLDVQMGGEELLPGLTAVDLRKAEKWYYNEYRGGRNADAYPHWDWACNYMSTLDFRGAWQEQNEGTTLQIRNSGDQRNNPANMDAFDSFVFGSKLITEDNKILSLRAQTHNADAAAPAYFGVQVIDLNAAQPKAEKVGNTRTHGGGYTDFEFDLQAYVGKEVIIAIGIYRQSTGDYWKQVVLRAIRFADRKVENWDWLPGTEVINGWKLSQETARSTMPHTKKTFTGLSPVSGNRDNYVDAYRAWRNVAHVGAEWMFMPLKKDPEVFPSEGYIIKTRNTPEVDTKVPEAYMYAKFSVAAGSNRLALSTRNFGSNFTYFKLTAIGNDGSITHLSPASNTAQQASAASDGCWRFKHGDGGAGNPEGYAVFNYDLSAFNGKDVTLALGVYNGEANTGENKLVIHNIKIN
ncbi:carboxypeptidase-like regulatory domain-containing protein [Sphingobacterium oryzagri]|uniref:Carboxypeptidase-like regulatory domain-containing protein n=1 Tax=Sphingobacterium oryzagri TaxID=3025669 RepID=A0ABY7WLG8_9SPHI|nr:carboxypeptidase-like regulatory domain-containing protein [Sphingobacterium sp. KACC 22765]WDF70442.1 carboxypeptidase-like regulatory domain-containing protein [Sphingobacterium sp. KACC 22765]